MSDEDFSNGIDSNEGYKAVQKIAAEEHAGVLPICAQIEEEIVEMDKEEKEMFLADMGLEKAVLTDLSRNAMHFSDLSPTLQPANRRFVHGQSKKEQKHLRQRAKFTRILSVDLSEPRLSHMTTLSPAEV